MLEIDKKQLTALILAGGKSSRMEGNDKGLMKFNEKFLIQHLHSLANKFCNNVLVNANRNLDEYRAFGFTICNDLIDGYQGPLAGMYTGLEQAKTDYLITLPCDGPFINESYFKKMILLEKDFDINVAFDGNRVQPVYCLLRKDLKKSLKLFLESGQRKIDKWFESCSVNLIDFSNDEKMFININDKLEFNKYKNKIEEFLNNNE
ncbi:MAG: molybdenum cofactor guanylyltransferase MobA [Pseudomonadota bacterium]|nr:molybdenum cofactor guanylyltransferase MobA [Pseudomonadota bacterium]